MMAEHDDPEQLPEIRLYFREWRDRAGISQDRLAELMGTSGGTISKHENEKRSGVQFDYLVKFATAVGCKPWDPLIGPPGILPEIGKRLLELNPADQQLILGIIELLRARYP